MIGYEYYCTTHVSVDIVLVYAVEAADVLLARQVLLPLLARGSNI